MEIRQNARARALPLPPILITAGAVLVAVGLVLIAVQVWIRYQDGLDQQAADSFTTAVAPAAREAGRLVVVDIDPELAAFQAGAVDPAKLKADSTAWAAAFDRTRVTFEQAPRMGRLSSTESGFAQAIDQYAAAARLISTEAAAAGADRKAAIAAGVTAFDSADRTYDSAEHQLVCLRQRLGLPAVSEFPLHGSC